jgi:methylated-DNA-[protein]-cysteine S-methyltransferase
MKENHLAWINTPFGSVAITQTDGQLHVELLGIAMSSHNYPSSNSQVIAAYDQIVCYLQDPSYQCKLPPAYQLAAVGTKFQCSVWQAIYAIPSGETRSYGQIAATLGSGARAVANACGANPLPLLIPCHRVVAQNGIGGFMQGTANSVVIKQWLLQHEGVVSDE